VGAANRFRPGHVPANKGLRRPGWSSGRMRETQFKKGNKPHTWKPIGSTRLSKEGYLQRKISDTGYPPKDWVGVHIMMWEKVRGPVPKGFVVCFKDRDKAHLELGNFELISRKELMQRNTIHRLPAELAEVIRLSASLKRQIRKIDEEQDQRPAQSSL
jgi:HNH endonuclease